MALTVLQNCQRAIIFMEFLILTIVTTFLTIKLIKKKIDNAPPTQEVSGESVGPKYKDSQSTQNIAGGPQFDQLAIKANTFTEYDNCTQRFMKKMCELSVIYNPLFLALPLNFILGRSYAFEISIYFIAATFCIFFNVFKIHRACIDYKISRLFLESIWILLSVLLLINIWTQNTSTMLYNIKQG